ncbi:MAG: extracellular solute-binding protein, partial [Chloroflexota bacterium]|nr:extracellular solute-binding protein [Chloroflexota bacterium]
MGTIGRRSYFYGTVAALGGLLAAACDPFGSSRGAGESGRLAGPAPGQPARRKGPLAIRVLYGPWQGPLFTAVTSYVLNAAGQRIAPQEELYRSTAFAAFRDRYPDSSVELGVVNDPLLVAEATHAAGEAPDIFQLDDRRGADVIRRGAVARLDGRVRQWSGHADLVRPAWEAGRAGRHQWGLPLCTFVYTCYFDAAVLQEVGIARLPGTWEQLLTVADRSTVVVRGHRLARQGMTTPDSQWFWWLLQSMGATLYEDGKARLADGEAETALRFLRDLHRAVQPPGVTPLPKPRGFVPDGLESVRLWEAGQVAHAWASRLPPRSADSARQHHSQV